MPMPAKQPQNSVNEDDNEADKLGTSDDDDNSCQIKQPQKVNDSFNNAYNSIQNAHEKQIKFQYPAKTPEIEQESFMQNPMHPSKRKQSLAKSRCFYVGFCTDSFKPYNSRRVVQSFNVDDTGVVIGAEEVANEICIGGGSKNSQVIRPNVFGMGGALLFQAIMAVSGDGAYLLNKNNRESHKGQRFVKVNQLALVALDSAMMACKKTEYVSVLRTKQEVFITPSNVSHYVDEYRDFLRHFDGLNLGYFGQVARAYHADITTNMVAISTQESLELISSTRNPFRYLLKGLMLTFDSQNSHLYKIFATLCFALFVAIPIYLFYQALLLADTFASFTFPELYPQMVQALWSGANVAVEETVSNPNSGTTYKVEWTAEELSDWLRAKQREKALRPPNISGFTYVATNFFDSWFWA